MSLEGLPDVSGPGAAGLHPGWKIVAALAAVAVVLVGYIHLRVLTLDAPQSYREDGILLITDALVQGRNPYALASQPVDNNVYGPAYHWVVWPFAKLFGGGYATHRAVSGVFVLATLGLIFGTLRRLGVSTLLCFVAAALLYADLAGRHTDLRPFGVPLSITARPDAMGLFVFLLSILIPWRDDFSRRSLIASMALSIVGLLTKPYFVVGFPIVASYLFLFRVRGRATVYGVCFLAAVAAVVWLVTLKYECYLANSITGNQNSTGERVPRHLAAQAWVFVRSLPGCASMLIAAVLASRFWNGRWWREVDFVGYALVVCLAAVAFRLGQHGGNTMLYFYQFLSPLLLLVVFRYLSRPGRRLAWVWPALVGLDLALLLIVWRPVVPGNYGQVWGEWRSMLAGKKDVYAPPPLAWMQREAGLRVYDSGMSEYFMFSAKWSPYPPTEVLQQRLQQYLAEVERKVVNEEFDLIILPYQDDKPLFCFVPTEQVAEHYEQVGVMDMPMDWEPIYKGLVLRPKGRVIPQRP